MSLPYQTPSFNTPPDSLKSSPPALAAPDTLKAGSSIKTIPSPTDAYLERRRQARSQHAVGETAGNPAGPGRGKRYLRLIQTLDEQDRRLGKQEGQIRKLCEQVESLFIIVDNLVKYCVEEGESAEEAEEVDWTEKPKKDEY